ncbi:hypothetical protein DEU56DRAFT_895339, partial [Suillus clintonianus]|uniref:uncharacterized protein n=1 Tax=Suillus clintonianus TaxID=1904413 RepID=UPI001B885A91
IHKDAPLYGVGTRLHRRRYPCASHGRPSLGANELITQGVIKVVGGLLTPESQHAEPQDRKFVGSALIYEAESLKDVRRIVEADLYWKEGVVSDACFICLFEHADRLLGSGTRRNWSFFRW